MLKVKILSMFIFNKLKFINVILNNNILRSHIRDNNYVVSRLLFFIFFIKRPIKDGKNNIFYEKWFLINLKFTFTNFKITLNSYSLTYLSLISTIKSINDSLVLMIIRIASRIRLFHSPVKNFTDSMRRS